ncbi:hypothetical protein RF11_14002 [Thelohanellus kitauei]|uniref:Uncharacterized protein n=1 Tax=Thelohanellus kitauei TaxID=669202 RepID=A0A0C2N3A8_THEKT|nr:hypothetical protein RF11_14002 [Thelohanellus kitauei]
MQKDDFYGINDRRNVQGRGQVGYDGSARGPFLPNYQKNQGPHDSRQIANFQTSRYSTSSYRRPNQNQSRQYANQRDHNFQNFQNNTVYNQRESYRPRRFNTAQRYRSRKSFNPSRAVSNNWPSEMYYNFDPYMNYVPQLPMPTNQIQYKSYDDENKSRKRKFNSKNETSSSSEDSLPERTHFKKIKDNLDVVSDNNKQKYIKLPKIQGSFFAMTTGENMKKHSKSPLNPLPIKFRDIETETVDEETFSKTLIPLRNVWIKLFILIEILSTCLVIDLFKS